MSGQAISYPHKRIKDRTYDIPIISTNYGFMNDDTDKREDKEKGMPIIVLHDKETGIKIKRERGGKEMEGERVKERKTDIWREREEEREKKRERENERV